MPSATIVRFPVRLTRKRSRTCDNRCRDELQRTLYLDLLEGRVRHSPNEEDDSPEAQHLKALRWIWGGRG
jgi:hypothetical protein